MLLIVRPSEHPTVVDVTIGPFTLAKDKVCLLPLLELVRRWSGFAHRRYIFLVVTNPLNDIPIVSQSELVLMALLK